MWESRVLGGISKSLWEPFCGFHRDDISIAGFPAGPNPGMLYLGRAVDRRTWSS
jgi:hypothetical protein